MWVSNAGHVLSSMVFLSSPTILLEAWRCESIMTARRRGAGRVVGLLRLRRSSRRLESFLLVMISSWAFTRMPDGRQEGDEFSAKAKGQVTAELPLLLTRLSTSLKLPSESQKLCRLTS